MKTPLCGALAALALAITACGGGGSKKPRPTAGPAPDAPTDLSGTLGNPGGMILPGGAAAIHVAHWPLNKGDKITLRTKNGKRLIRTIEKKENRGGDVAVLTFDRPINPTQHNLIPIAPGRRGPVTILRLDRPPLTAEITRTGQGLRADLDFEDTIEGKALKTGTNSLRHGDSGKIWLQNIDRQTSVVGLTSRGTNHQSPNLTYRLPRSLWDPPKVAAPTK